MVLEVKSIAKDKIYLNPDNTNFMTVEQKIKLRNSIKEFGFLVPILVKEMDGAYMIVDGEHRYQALKDAGETEMPCIVVDTEKDINILQASINTVRGNPDYEKFGEVLTSLKKKGFEKNQAKDLFDVPEKFIDKIYSESIKSAQGILDESKLLDQSFADTGLTNFNIFISYDKYDSFLQELEVVQKEYKKKIGDNDLIVTRFNIDQFKEALASLKDSSPNSMKLSVLFNLFIDKYFEMRDKLNERSLPKG